METKKCKVCDRELPLDAFRFGKGGARISTCRDCVQSKRAQSLENKRFTPPLFRCGV